MKSIIPGLLGHYVPPLSSKYLEKGDRHLVSHLQRPSFDATLHQHTIQSRTKCFIWHVSLGLAESNSPYFNVVKSYTFFCFPTCNSC